MAVRIISLALVAAIVACPLLCRSGQCQECCAQQEIAQPTCPTTGIADCCCPASSDQGTSGGGESQRPRDDDSGESGCQGVCGGAVLDKPKSPPEPAKMSFLCDRDAGLTATPSRLVGGQSHSITDRLERSMNRGRYLRTLYESLLL